jgi:hypothetical protein
MRDAQSKTDAGMITRTYFFQCLRFRCLELGGESERQLYGERLSWHPPRDT